VRGSHSPQLHNTTSDAITATSTAFPLAVQPAATNDGPTA
jgi:hypothetical protein